MTLATLIARGLRHHWRAHLGVLLGATLGSAVLVGALAVGDSVRDSLRRIALARLGEVRLALGGGDRFFRSALAGDLERALGAPTAPIILLSGTAATESARAAVQVVGVDRRFFQLGRAQPPMAGHEEIAISTALARRLGVGAGAGDELLVRVHKPAFLSRDAPIASVEDASVALRLPVAAVAGEEAFGRFGLQANQAAPLTVFIPLERLAREIEQPGRANVLLVGAGEGGAEPTPERAAAALSDAFQLVDAGLELRKLPARGAIELRTTRVFLDPSVGEAALEAAPGAAGVLTYFVNALRTGGRSTPYSAVAALDERLLASFQPTSLADDEILLNEWLARDLGAKVGDEVRLEYFIVGQARSLEERSARFRVAGVVPLSGAALDRDLMPEIPGLTDRAHCREWDPGIPIDLDRVRPADEAYWDQYGGTPKAFITLRAGQRLWSNRFGDLTAVRYEAAPGAAIEDRLRERIRPESVGLSFLPVREQALAASAPAVDFGALFLGLSFFLIAAALLLTGLLFLFGVESRGAEIGLLLALGFPAARVRRMLLLEGGVLALAAGAAGAALGLLYTKAVLHGLATVWRGAVADAPVRFHVEPATLLLGALSGAAVALLAITLVARKQARAPARELLAAGAESESRWLASEAAGKAPGARTALATGALALLLIAVGALRPREAAAGLYFGAGVLLLASGIAASRALLARLAARGSHAPLSLGSLGVRNGSRRPGRSLATVCMLACGAFLVIAVGANRRDPVANAESRASGTGGFAFYGETALPIYHDLNRPEGQESYGLDPEDLAEVSVVPLRLYPGDEASCLNLNRPQAPRLLGVPTALLRERFAIGSALRAPGSTLRVKAPLTFTRSAEHGARSAEWSDLLLDRVEPDGAVPAVGDVNTVVWSLGRSLGDTLSYVDERGRPFQVRIVGILGNGILQGSLLISERQFVERFPSRAGYQVFLIDLPRERAEAVAGTLSNALEDVGLELTPAALRLAEFSTVENTYLAIFAALGGLGLLIGTLGLGVVVLRNTLERRGELGLLRAVGFRRLALVWLAFSEAALLLLLGLFVGTGAGVVAVIPQLRAPGAGAPLLPLAGSMLLVLISGFLWTWGATWLSARAPLIVALRNE